MTATSDEIPADGGPHDRSCGCASCGGTNDMARDAGAGDSDAKTGNVYLDGLIWGTRWSAGHGPISFGFARGDGPPTEPGGPRVDGGAWNGTECEAAREALATWAAVADISFVETADAGDADIRFWKLDQSQFFFLGQHDVPDDADGQLDGYYGSDGRGWNAAGLQQGGYGFITLIHELGHGLGLAHPHDGGGESGIFPGVGSPWDSGRDGLNQGIWTTMSYVDGWDEAQPPGDAYGWQGTPMAFDVAAIQAVYGANTGYRRGDDAYALPDGNGGGTFFACIWDTGGADRLTARHADGDAAIDLRAAPLEGAHAAGWVSRIDGIFGGFTIANGVVIERAIGGGGDDAIGGNAADNILRGGSGDDVLTGRTGYDRLFGDSGADLFVYRAVSNSTAGATDVIRDFARGEGDRIDLARIDADAGRDGDQAFAFVGSAAFSGAAGELRVVRDGSDVMVRGDTDGDGTADLIIRVADADGLRADDFLL
jgi:serralysin